MPFHAAMLFVASQAAPMKDPFSSMLNTWQHCSHRSNGTNCERCKIRQISICAAFEPDDLDALQSMAQTISFAAKETIFLENDDSDAAFTVTEGALRLYRTFADGRRQVISFLLPGDFISVEADGRHEYSADSITEVTLCCFPKKQFAAVVKQRPHVLQRLYETTARELINAREHMLTLGQRSAAEKLAWFLVHLGIRQSCIDFEPNIVELPMSRQDIADHLGLTIETVSRTFSGFAREGIIAITPHGVDLLNCKKLEKLAAT